MSLQQPLFYQNESDIKVWANRTSLFCSQKLMEHIETLKYGCLFPFYGASRNIYVTIPDNIAFFSLSDEKDLFKVLYKETVKTLSPFFYQEEPQALSESVLALMDQTNWYQAGSQAIKNTHECLLVSDQSYQDIANQAVLLNSMYREIELAGDTITTRIKELQNMVRPTMNSLTQAAKNYQVGSSFLVQALGATLQDIGGFALEAVQLIEPSTTTIAVNPPEQLEDQVKIDQPFKMKR